MSKTIAFVSPKGGVKKTTSAFNIYGALINPFIISHDHTSNLDFINVQREKLKTKRETKDIEDYNFTQSIEFVDGEAVDTFEDSVSLIDNYEKETGEEQTVIFDFGGYITEAHTSIIGIADVIVIPTGSDEVDLQALKTISEQIAEVNKDNGTNIIGNVLLTNVHHTQTSESPSFKRVVEEVSKFSNLRLLETYIPRGSDMQNALSSGCNVFERRSTRNGKQANALRKLVKELNLPSNK